MWTYRENTQLSDNFFFSFLIVSAKHYGKQFLGQIVQVNLTDKSLSKMTSLGP